MRTRTLASLISLASLALSACATDSSPAEQARGAIGKADLIGSCSPLTCGGPAIWESEESCFCDDQCAELGDCCANKEEVCPSEEEVCDLSITRIYPGSGQIPASGGFCDAVETCAADEAQAQAIEAVGWTCQDLPVAPCAYQRCVGPIGGFLDEAEMASICGVTALEAPPAEVICQIFVQ